eukprot:scaffold206313_cov22-Tisochrysis_lutea.AAC.1
MVSYRWWVVCCSRPAAGALTCSPCFTHCYFRPPEHLYGAPPDAFSPTGQNWGFPTYNWEEMSKDNYKWWAWLCIRLKVNCPINPTPFVDLFLKSSAPYKILRCQRLVLSLQRLCNA